MLVARNVGAKSGLDRIGGVGVCLKTGVREQESGTRKAARVRVVFMLLLCARNE